MHELSLCQAIARIATQHAGPRRVTRVGLRVGQLRQVVPDTLVYCWSLVNEGTALEGSALDVESVPARLSCRQCGHDTTLGAPVLRCEACGGAEVDVISGEEFLVTTLDLAEV